MSEIANEEFLKSGGVKHVRWDELPKETLNPLFDRQLVVGDQVMIARILLKKGCVVPLHQHHNEQISYIQSGVLHFSLDGKEVTVKAGEFLCIPPNMPHTAVALEDSVGIDIFTPPREDWLNKTDQYLRR
jgi:quercetin dioxygenase-like cupin family protein